MLARMDAEPAIHLSPATRIVAAIFCWCITSFFALVTYILIGGYLMNNENHGGSINLYALGLFSLPVVVTCIWGLTGFAWLARPSKSAWRWTCFATVLALTLAGVLLRFSM